MIINKTDHYLKYLEKIVKQADIEISNDQIKLLVEYMLKILHENKMTNLTSITDPEEFLEKHILDSLLALRFIKTRDQHIIDIGTGGGFPGVPLAIMLPNDNFVLLDSTKKKLAIVEKIIKQLQIKNVLCVHARAEEASKLPAFREKYDIAISRAVASLPILSELCLPFVKPGGIFLALKSKQYHQEIAMSEEIIEELGGSEIAGVETKLIPSESTRVIIQVIKKFKTPQKYPRNYSQIKKANKVENE